MAAKIESDLQDELKRHPPWPIQVEIEFSELPPPGQLEKLGLKLEGQVAWGTLNAERIEAIATLPQVTAIRRSQRPTTPVSQTPEERLGITLKRALQDEDRQEFDVIVTFRGPVNDVEMPGLSVHLAMGNGRLRREQIMDLAKRDEVQSIDLSPKMQFH
jgi:hypothetical protein